MKIINIKFKTLRKSGLVIVSLILFIIVLISRNKNRSQEIKVNAKSCVPQTNILFLKTHKTASTTIRSILVRFATQHQLLLAMPSYHYYMRFSKTFQSNMLLNFKPGYQQNLFAEHVRFDYEQMQSVMAEGTTFVTILRDPVSQFESLYTFLDLASFYRMDFTTFANLDTTDSEWLTIRKERAAKMYGPNQMAFDLGIDPELFDDDEAILREIQRLDQQFDLVMITELMDESLILLKDTLCWSSINDVVTLKLNARRPQLKHTLTINQITNLRKINRADQIVYDYFYDKFQKKLNDFGFDKMNEEVKQLKIATKQLYDTCVDDDLSREKMNQNAHQTNVARRKNGTNEIALCDDINPFDFFFVMDLYKKQKQYYDITDDTTVLLDILSLIANTIKHIF